MLFWKENWSGFDTLLCKNLFFWVNGFKWLFDSETGDDGIVLLNNDDGGNSNFIIVGGAAGDLASIVFVVVIAVDNN